MSRYTLEFTNNKLTQTFEIINDSQQALDFTVRKHRHVEHRETGLYFEENQPLHWVDIGLKGSAVQTQSFDVLVDGNGGSVEIEVSGVVNSTLSSWEGTLVIENPLLGDEQITLSYVERPDGRWAGKMYYFSTFGDGDLDGYLDALETGDPDVIHAAASQVKNAFIRRWSAFRYKRYVTSLDEWLAVLTATRSGSWDWTSTRQKCAEAGYPGVCYSYAGDGDVADSGVRPYASDEGVSPVPSGVIDFPFAINLKVDPLDSTKLSGRISTAHTLQYPANPAISVRFRADPTTCAADNAVACFADLERFAADILVGGRYLAASGAGTCSMAEGLELHGTPWLVPGFTQFTGVDEETLLRYRYECRDTQVPFDDQVVDNPEALNLSFAQSNPVPDGKSRRRHIELIDGALINNDSMFVIFRETFESLLSDDPTDDLHAYGYMMLQRSAANIPPADFVGSTPIDDRATSSTLGSECSSLLLDTITVGGASVGSVTNLNAADVARVVLSGVDQDPTGAIISSTNVHYLCVTSEPIFSDLVFNEETGQWEPGERLEVVGARTISFFDGGGQQGDRIDCPAGSTVEYFVLPRSVDSEPCNETLECKEQLDTWRDNCAAGDCLSGLQLDPPYRCVGSEVHCDDNRYDLIADKQFFNPAAPAAPAFSPLQTAIDDAFRYRSRFVNRDGTGLGFAPDICENGGDALPYCYDPAGIELAGARVECLVHIFTNHYNALEADGYEDTVRDFLEVSFAWEETPGGEWLTDGFERLNAELLIMLGDDAYTEAFASRFDLSGSAVRGFEGTLFEPGGINLSGGAGFEMVKLYQATQYYQMALDRFYGLLPSLSHAIEVGGDHNVVTLGTVVAYFDRLIRASAQKSRAMSEIAQRYHSFNRTDLARRVIERGYSAAYMESVILSHLMLRMRGTLNPEDRAQVVTQIREASLGYRSALLQMRKIYDDFSDDLTYFGFAPDYVPFPALDANEGNAFEKLFGIARQKMLVAADKEERALAVDRSYDSDSVSFQNELARIGINYEDRLAEICGAFVGDDGAVYPAISKYAYLSEPARLLGDPCGFVGNGSTYLAMSNAEVVALDLRSVVQAAENVLAEMTIEEDRVQRQCDLAFSLADMEYSTAGKVRNLSTDISEIRGGMAQADRVLKEAVSLATLSKCLVMGGTAVGSDCPSSIVAIGSVMAATVAHEALVTFAESEIRNKEREIAGLQSQQQRYATGEHQCLVMQSDSTARINTLALRLHELDLERLKAQYRLAQAVSEIQKLHNQATRLSSEQQELEQQTINLEAARNNPNMRIYKNDAILTADRTFQIALKEAYKATKVFEYYTSQTYAELGDLFLVRMVAHGDISLEAYLDGLESAYYDFEEQFGIPDVRVAIVSMRDDIMQLPRFDTNNRTLSHAERVRQFRQRLGDVRLLDDRGYTTVPFGTSLDDLSPMTRNHKIAYIEAEIIGSDIGDAVGRVYLRQRGTGVVRGLYDETAYFAFPERTAVIDPFFNGQRFFAPEVYRNGRLKDRPMVNTRWEAVFNQRDELVNQDININSLSDVRFYVYYTDFTPF